MTRPLTEQQQRRLCTAAFYGITSQVERSLPSLEKRGLVERYRHTEHGRSIVDWRVTDTGLAEAKRIRAAQRAADESSYRREFPDDMKRAGQQVRPHPDGK